MNWDILNSKLNSSGGENISTLTVVIILAGIISLIALFWLLRKYFFSSDRSRRSDTRYSRVFFVTETVLWLFFSGISIYHLLLQSFWITAVFLLLIILGFLNFWRDLFTGLLFRFENRFHLGDPVQYETTVGNLVGIGRRYITIKTSEDEMVYLPFRLLDAGKLIKKRAKDKLISAKVRIPTSSDKLQSEEKLNRWLKHCPWVIYTETARISSDHEGWWITIHVVHAEEVRKTEKYLEEKLKID